MFGKNVLVKINKATDGTLTATAEERNLTQAVGDYAKSLFDDEIATSGFISTLMPFGLAYASSVGTNRVLTGRWHVNPLAV